MLCEDYRKDEDGICNTCSIKYNICMNCYVYSQLCLNCEQDDGPCLSDL